MMTRQMHYPIAPKRIEIELASACNLQCSYCPRHFLDNLNGFIDIHFFTGIIDEIESNPEIILVLHRRGESLLHPKFPDIMKYVKGKFKEIQLATNATMLDETKSKAIIESVHFLSFRIAPAVTDIFHGHQQYRGPLRNFATLRHLGHLAKPAANRRS
jgi:MoaA/NifB/PqqE/SkfB family radical SAM enzyme